MLRNISILFRFFNKNKEVKRVLDIFEDWKKTIDNIPVNTIKNKKILLIRIDDIGDYLLFRNSFYAYKHSKKYADYSITLLGNSAWRDLYNNLDSTIADNTIWVNKNDYFNKSEYRLQLWETLRKEGFEIVICPSRSRPLVLDDLCMLAANATNNIAAHNNFNIIEWNKVSDNLYTELYPDSSLTHEFFYNQQFSNWCCETNLSLERPEIKTIIPEAKNNTILCFIGASKKSKRWPPEKWIELLHIIKKETNYTCIIAGGKDEINIAEKINAPFGFIDITGKATLPQMIEYINNATIVITHDTMAAHLSVSLAIPTIIITNGDNFYRFTDYNTANIANVSTVYPAMFLKKLEINKHQSFKGYEAVTKDIATINPLDVYTELKKYLDINK